MQHLITKKLIEPWPEKLIWISEVEVPKEKQLSNVNYVVGLPALSAFEALHNALVVLDDLQHIAAESSTVSALFRRLSHHNNIAVFLLVQNLSFQGRQALDSRRNADYLFLFRNPVDVDQYRRYQSKLGLNEKTTPSLNQLINFASRSNPHFCLVVDLKFETPDLCRFRGDPRDGERQPFYGVHNVPTLLFQRNVGRLSVAKDNGARTDNVSNPMRFHSARSDSTQRRNTTVSSTEGDVDERN